VRRRLGLLILVGVTGGLAALGTNLVFYALGVHVDAWSPLTVALFVLIGALAGQLTLRAVRRFRVAK
jgi:hypothetical protein